MTVLGMVCDHIMMNPNTLICDLCGRSIEDIQYEKDREYESKARDVRGIKGQKPFLGR